MEYVLKLAIYYENYYDLLKRELLPKPFVDKSITYRPASSWPNTLSFFQNLFSMKEMIPKTIKSEQRVNLSANLFVSKSQKRP